VQDDELKRRDGQKTERVKSFLEWQQWHAVYCLCLNSLTNANC